MIGGDTLNLKEHIDRNLRVHRRKLLLWIFVGILSVIFFITLFLLEYLDDANTFYSKFFLAFFFLLGGMASVYGDRVYRNARESFMLQIAKDHQLSYSPNGSSEGMRAHIFKYRGVNGISHVLWGMYGGNPITVFLYKYSTGGDTPRIFPYTVCQIQYKGKVPSVMMTNLKHKKPPFFERMYRKKLTFGNDVDKYFSILAPEDFQIEALEILTPEIAQTILSEGREYSFEFIDHYLYLYTQSHISDATTFEHFISFGKYLSETLGPRLERLSRDVEAMHKIYEKSSA